MRRQGDLAVRDAPVPALPCPEAFDAAPSSRLGARWFSAGGVPHHGRQGLEGSLAQALSFQHGGRRGIVPGRDGGICSARLHGRTMNKVGVVRPPARQRVQIREALPASTELRGGSRCASPHNSPGLPWEYTLMGREAPSAPEPDAGPCENAGQTSTVRERRTTR